MLWYWKLLLLDALSIAYLSGIWYFLQGIYLDKCIQAITITITCAEMNIRCRSGTSIIVSTNQNVGVTGKLGNLFLITS